MRSKWYTSESVVNGEHAYIAAYSINAFKDVNRRNERTCGGFSRNRETVERLVAALNERDRGTGKIYRE